MTNTLCPKIGAAQWTCTRDECTCHLKESIGVRVHESFVSQPGRKIKTLTYIEPERRHGAAVACALAASPRPTYDEAVKHRPPGACYCDLDDRACYAAGHWEVMPVCPWSSDHGLCRDVRCTNCEHYNSGLRN